MRQRENIFLPHGIKVNFRNNILQYSIATGVNIFAFKLSQIVATAVASAQLCWFASSKGVRMKN